MVVLVLAGFEAAQCEAGSRTFKLNGVESVVTLSGSVLGNALAEQAAGSLTTSMSGTVVVDLTNDAIQFATGSLIVALNNGTWQPNVGGASGSALGNFGAKADSLLGSAKAALREIQLNISSLAMAVTGGSFNSSGLTFAFPSTQTSTLDYAISSFFSNTAGTIPLVGLSTNNVTTQATLATVGNTQVLTIPVDAQFKLKLLTDNDTVLSIRGKLVATADVSVALTIQDIHVKNNTVTMSWISQSNRLFQIQSTSDLKSWSNRGPQVTSTSTDYSWSGEAQAGPEFLRLLQVGP